MRPRIVTLALLLTGLAASPSPCQKGVDLDQLIELAKTRADKIRQALESKLEPHMQMLSSSYKQNWADIEDHIEAIEKLGDSVVPLLLEKLVPRTSSPAHLNLAANAARALAKFDPASFLDSLIDIAEGESYAGVGHAIPLLGLTGSPRAGATLTRLLDRKDKAHRMEIIRALAKLGHKDGVLKVAKMLPFPSQKDDEIAAGYLSSVCAPAVLPEVFRALAEVKRGAQIMRYIGILRSCAVRDPEAAHKLLKYYDNQKLDRSELARLSDTIAVVAPIGDEVTIKRLKAMLASGETGGLELRTALALHQLGDKNGPALLRRNLIKKTRGSKNKKYYLNHANLGEFYLEFGEYKQAVDAFKQAITHATGNAMRSMLYLQVARAQALRKKWNFVRDALRDSKVPYDRLIEASKEFPELERAMQEAPVKKFMAAFGN